tara:strand:+ start:1253 stop:2152 length:900 start_codon:yes stop_codon:yes gene_type:complete
VNLLITGSSGYLGRNFLETVKNDDNLYFFLVRSKKKILKFKKIKNIEFIECDLKKYDEVKKKLKNYQIDIIINFAWVGATNKFKNSNLQKQNLLLLKNLVKISKVLKIKKFVGFGSQAEYGLKKKKINELMICRPITKYGHIKLKSYKLLNSYFKKNKIKFVWIRLFSSFGPHDDDNFLIPYLIKNFLKNKKIYLTKCEQKWDFIYSKDVIKATKFLAHSNMANGIYNLGSGETQNLKSIVLKIKKLTKSGSKIDFGALKYSKNQIMYLHADINKIREINWKYSPHFDQAIRETIKYYK